MIRIRGPFFHTPDFGWGICAGWWMPWTWGWTSYQDTKDEA